MYMKYTQNMENIWSLENLQSEAILLELHNHVLSNILPYLVILDIQSKSDHSLYYV